MTTGIHKSFNINNFTDAVYEPVTLPGENPHLPKRDVGYTRLENEIKAQLQNKGLQDGLLTEGSLRVRFGFTSDHLFSDVQLASFMGLSPGLATNPEDSTLTIGISLIRADNGEVLWKGALQGVMLRELDPEQKDQRLKRAVATLLSQL